MAGRFSEKCKVTVSENSMSATLFIEPPENGIAYSVDELTTFIKNKGIYGGVIYSELERMSQNNIYYKDHEIAKGTYPVEGSDGYYELFFDNEKNRKPTIRSDGSVDYQSMSEIRCVNSGDKLIKYHAAVLGKSGLDVRGRTLRPKPCKDMPPLKGNGWEFDDETGEYRALNEGRIEYDGKTLKVLNIYEHKGDLDLVVGRIDFRGDVVIKGNVLSGTFIRATKSIIVEGSVEAATLIAGGDIILKKGMQGGKKARISCGGDLYANFIEFTKIDVKGKVEANIIMNSQISSGTDVIVSGRKGAIVGGETYAVGSVSTMFVGNNAELKTVVAVGVTKELYDRVRVLNTKKTGLLGSIDKTNKEIMKVVDNRIYRYSKEVQAAKLSQLKRRLSKDEKLVAHIDTEIEKINYTMAVGKRAKISVGGTVYVGSEIIVNDSILKASSEYKHSEFTKDELTDTVAILPTS